MKSDTYSLVRNSAAVGVALAGFLLALPVYAQTTSGSPTYVPPPHSTSTPPIVRPLGHERTSSSTIMMNREARQASSTAHRIIQEQDRGDTMLTQRINSLNSLISRIQGMKYISDSEKNSLITSLNAEIAQLGGLKTEVDADTSTTSLKNDVASITKSYRIYALVQPQTVIISAGDRILNIVSLMNTIVGKVNARLASTTNASSTVQTTLSDINSKLTDATTQANAAIAEVVGLKPDNGNSGVATSNASTLKDARSKIGLAEKDLIAVRQDIKSIIKGFNK